MRNQWFFIWTKLNPIHQRLLCAKFVLNRPSGSGEEDFLILSIYFRFFLIISPWKREGPFIWTNLNPLHPRMLCAKFGWNWPSGSWEEVKNRKSLQTDGQTDGQTDRQTDDGRKAIRKAHLSFQLRWAKKIARSKSKQRIWLFKCSVYISLNKFSRELHVDCHTINTYST